MLTRTFASMFSQDLGEDDMVILDAAVFSGLERG